MAIQNLPAAIEYGRRPLPTILDSKAGTEPEREAFQIPRSANPADGWKPVTFREFANAVNRVAHMILETLGEPKTAFPTIAYVGPNDARYIIFQLAAMKVGYKAFFPSPRNALDGQMNLFKELECHVIAFPSSQRSLVQPWLDRRDMKALEVDSLDTWLDARPVAPVAYSKNFEESQWDPALVLHTSGSTGFPKPIVIRVGLLATGDAMRNLPAFHGTKFFFHEWTERVTKHFNPMPLFHAAGFYLFINMVLHYDRSVAFGVDRPISSDLMMQSLENLNVDSTVLPPSILEDMSHDEAAIKTLKKLKTVGFGGGNLSPETGNRLVKHGVHLVNGIGSTEMTPLPIHFQPNPELWQYFIFNSEALGADWRPVDDGDLRELVVIRKDKRPGIQGCFYTFPDEQVFTTKDLFRPHPSLLDHWMFCGRCDNIIVFSNGEKLNPISIEETIESHPDVKGAIVVGVGRFQPGVIIEPTSRPSNESEFLDNIWPLISQANEMTVAHGRVGRDMVMLSDPDKPFPRSGKGMIQRPNTLKLYEDEIERLYEDAAEVSSTEAPKLETDSDSALASSIMDMFHTSFGISKLEADTDFFSLGVDSLQVINATKLLRQGLDASGYVVKPDQLAPAKVYSNPTPRLLSKYVMENIVNPTGSESGSQEPEPHAAMNRLYETYTQDLPQAKHGRHEANDLGQTVVLTGSTGMLGSYMLNMMVESDRVKTIICLNRTDDGGLKRQFDAMKSRGLTTRFDKAEFHHVDISQPDFGLSPSLLSRLSREVDRWIHNAWPVNFNFTVDSFEPHIKGVRNVANFAAQAEKRVAVTFISSIGTTERWSLDAPVPEERLNDLTLPSGGYGQSKLIGSLILDEVAKAGDFPAVVIRVGQVAGPQSELGAWNRHEWLPSIIASSLHLKALPSDLGLMNRVDWIPAESVAGLVLDVSGVSQQLRPEEVGGYYHAVNPEATAWPALAPAVREWYGKSRLPEMVSFAEWISRLEKSEIEPANPGLKLVDTYSAMNMAAQAGHKGVVHDTRRTIYQSPTLKNTHAVTPQLMQLWCKQWGF